MPDTVTYSEKSRPAVSHPQLLIQENFEALLNAGIDDVFKREFAEPMQGEQFYTARNTDKLSESFQSVIGLGHVGQNRDADVIPGDEQQIGFSNTIENYIYRGRVGHERVLLETEQYGMLGDNQRELADAAKRSVELILADPLNRALGASGAPFLCEDGMYLLDQDRPNAHVEGGTWSNAGDASSITAAALFTTELAARSYKSERGHLSPKSIKRIIIRPEDEEALWTLLKSDGRPTDNSNAKNFQYGRFTYTVYDRLTSPVILFELEGMNELYLQWRKRFDFKSWEGADNPDIFWQRVRFAMGLGCNRPHAWYGWQVS